MKKVFAAAVSLLLGLDLTGIAGGIDNSSFLPPYKPDSEVKMEPCTDGTVETPDWVKSMIFITARIDAVSSDETMKGMKKFLDHLAETGINGIWLTPPLNGGNGYGNYGIHTRSERLIGEKEPTLQWKVLYDFVQEAHKRNIRVLFDVVEWGTTEFRDGPNLRKLKPEWYGAYFRPYRGWFFNWKNRELREWFAANLTEWVIMTGADGLRCDTAPKYSGFESFDVAKKRLKALGKKVILMSELTTTGNGVFDLDQLTFLYRDRYGVIRQRWVGDYYMTHNIVDAIKSGEGLYAWNNMKRPPGTKRFHTFMLSCHDSKDYIVKGSPIVIGYQAILAPFIPLWYIGEEWNNPKEHFVDFFVKRDKIKRTSWNLYDTKIDWKTKEQDKNKAFFEKVKKMIRIRRSNPDIFEYFPDNHRNSNICKVETDHKNLLQAYARYRGGRAIIVVPNNGKTEELITVSVPFADAGIPKGSTYLVTDLMEGKQIASGKLSEFKAKIGAGELGVYEIRTNTQKQTKK